MQFSTITQLILLATAPLAMASVAAERTSSNSVFDVRMECIKSNCGGVGAACAGAWVSHTASGLLECSSFTKAASRLEVAL